MSSLLKSKKIIYVFILFFSVLALDAFFIYQQFFTTKDAIIKNQLQANIQYIDYITSNLSQMILQESGIKSPLQALKKSKNLRKNLEKNLKLFKTNRYRYIYVVYKEKSRDTFRFLLDSSKKDRGNFLEAFQPFNLQEWKKVYVTKKANYFINKDAELLWLTYLKPIVKKGSVVAVIAIDFSLKEQNIIKNILESLTRELKIFTLLLIMMLVLLILFLLYERKKINILNEQAQEIRSFNDTLKQKIEEEVFKNREKDKQILVQARLAQLGEMLGMIAHQWRQPLSAIGSANIAINMKAQMEQLDSKTIIELTNKIDEFTQHLSRTIDDFRNFFKNTKEKKKISYGEVIAETLNIVQSSLKNKNIRLITDLQNDVVFDTYPSELKQVLLNLIKNAEDVLIEKNIEDPYIKITTNGNNLYVSDNGGGVPEEIIDKIFDPYFSTKDLNGTGLGLYMSKVIIEEHCQGKLSLINEMGGAVFAIELI